MTAPLHDTTRGRPRPSMPRARLVRRRRRSRDVRLGRIAWNRLKRDKVALAGGIVVLVLIAVAVFAPLIVSLLGHPPDELHEDQIDPLFGTPIGACGGISGELLLGVEPVNGRDVFSRIVYGARISLLVGFLSAFVAVTLGTVLGVIAGYFGGWLDAAISRVMDLLLAFPQLLFIIALISVVPNELFGLTGSGLRIAVLILVIGFFGWPYIGRIVRGQTLSLREREYVEAARSLGAGRRTSSSRNCCPTWSRRSPSTRR